MKEKNQGRRVSFLEGGDGMGEEWELGMLIERTNWTILVINKLKNSSNGNFQVGKHKVWKLYFFTYSFLIRNIRRKFYNIQHFYSLIYICSELKNKIKNWSYLIKWSTHSSKTWYGSAYFLSKNILKKIELAPV